MAVDSKREAPGENYAGKPARHAYGSQGNFVRLSAHPEMGGTFTQSDGI